MKFGDIMSKVQIYFKIVSKDSNESFHTTGEIKQDRIIFKDTNENMHYIIYKGNDIQYHKRGEVEMRYDFIKHKQTKGYYNLQGNRFVFDIKTDTLLLQENRFYIKYRLYQNNDLVNDTVLEIKYDPYEEEKS